jgi:hypothetical protein
MERRSWGPHASMLTSCHAGIIGLLTAETLLARGLSVALVERKQLCAGATGAGQGYVWMAHRSPSTAVWDLAELSIFEWGRMLQAQPSLRSSIEWQVRAHAHVRFTHASGPDCDCEPPTQARPALVSPSMHEGHWEPAASMHGRGGLPAQAEERRTPGAGCGVTLPGPRSAPSPGALHFAAPLAALPEQPLSRGGRRGAAGREGRSDRECSRSKHGHTLPLHRHPPPCSYQRSHLSPLFSSLLPSSCCGRQNGRLTARAILDRCKAHHSSFTLLMDEPIERLLLEPGEGCPSGVETVTRRRVYGRWGWWAWVRRRRGKGWARGTPSLQGRTSAARPMYQQAECLSRLLLLLVKSDFHLALAGRAPSWLPAHGVAT